ncbi:Hypothetical protein D9617_6g093980 [Elsinoe fawcettii]|nr:Hypothetical protein D9617_6g093980 [Elsinoe fawcettii]
MRQLEYAYPKDRYSGFFRISDADDEGRIALANAFLKHKAMCMAVVCDHAWSEHLVRTIGEKLNRWKATLEACLIDRGILRGSIAGPHTGLSLLTPAEEQGLRTSKPKKAADAVGGTDIHELKIDSVQGLQHFRKETLEEFSNLLMEEWGAPSRNRRRQNDQKGVRGPQDEMQEADVVGPELPKPRPSFPAFSDMPSDTDQARR